MTRVPSPRPYPGARPSRPRCSRRSGGRPVSSASPAGSIRQRCSQWPRPSPGARGSLCPIPLTLRFPGIAEADEAAWQEAVLASVPVEDWVRVEIHDELSVVGPVATDVLRRHGLVWPFNAYVHVPVLERARAGSVLTGFGGDELMAGSRWDRLAAVAAGRAGPRPRDVRRVVLAMAPRGSGLRPCGVAVRSVSNG